MVTSHTEALWTLRSSWPHAVQPTQSRAQKQQHFRFSKLNEGSDGRIQETNNKQPVVLFWRVWRGGALMLTLGAGFEFRTNQRTGMQAGASDWLFSRKAKQESWNCNLQSANAFVTRDLSEKYPKSPWHFVCANIHPNIHKKCIKTLWCVQRTFARQR